MEGGCFAENHIELQLRIKGATVFGDSYHYENINYYVKKKISGSFDAAAKRLTLHEDYVTTYHIPNSCKICMKNFYLTYTKDGKVETLNGTWNGKIKGTELECSGGPISLSRIKESAFKAIPEVLTDTGKVRLDFYDNATIDGDSITVLVNKKIVVVHQMLTARPITAWVHVSVDEPFFEVEMVAENEGRIPPNTALLIITAGKKKYQLFLSADKKKSAVIRIIYNKKQYDDHSP